MHARRRSDAPRSLLHGLDTTFLPLPYVLGIDILHVKVLRVIVAERQAPGTRHEPRFQVITE